jgi:hypothetical protein
MRYVLAFVPLLILSSTAAAQPTKSLIDSQRFVFQPWTAQPLRGATRNVANNNYTLTVGRDKIDSDLPYFGRAYVAPADPGNGGLEFTSKKFSFMLTPRKKDGWTVLIKPKDHPDIQQMQLTISSTGYASLQVFSTNRDVITFNGIISPPAKP